MEQTLSQRATDWREGRRLRAWELLQKGWRQKAVAEALGVTEGAVSQWAKRAGQGGVEALRRRQPSGAPPRLTIGQREQLLRLLEQGAPAFGFRGELWTCGRIAEVIRFSFGVSYHPSHVGRLLRACGWSVQRPLRRARQRDEAAIQQWKEGR